MLTYFWELISHAEHHIPMTNNLGSAAHWALTFHCALSCTESLGTISDEYFHRKFNISYHRILKSTTLEKTFEIIKFDL